jgi:hypothetical protein
MTLTPNLKILLAGTLLSILIMSYTGRPLKQSNSGFKSILSLEFANTAAKAEAIINSWQAESFHGKTLLEHARINTYWDFMFIFFYSTTLFFAHRELPKPGNKSLQILFTWLGVTAIAAGVLDIIENTGMLRSMNRVITDQNAGMTAGCARLKFILVSISIIGLLIRWLLHKISPTVK